MPAVNEKIIDNEDPLEPPSGPTSASTKQNTTLHSVALTGMPMHIYPYPALFPTQQPMKSKRRQVKNACTNCQKACKKCDDARPCLRCVKYGISEECVDSQRKERQKGIKRGPYKKRDGGKDRASSNDMPPQSVPVSNSHGGPSQQISSSHMPLSYPPGFYGQYSPLVSKPSDDLPTLPMYSNQPYFLSSVPHVQPHMHAASEGDNSGYPAQGFYPAPGFPPVAYHYPQYVSRSDCQGPIPMQYTVYPRQSLAAGQDEIQHASGSARNEEQDRVSSKADSEIRTL